MTKGLKILLLTTTLFFPILLTAQDKAAEPVQKLGDYVSSRPQEKIYIHFDKPFYSITDNIWFKVYLVNAISHLPRKDALAYVELLNPKGRVVARRNIQILDGGGYGDIELAVLGLNAGKYTMRAYTNYMRNFDKSFFFHQEIKIVDGLEEEAAPEPPQKVVMKFFPEGGELVAGQVNYVAVKATTGDDRGLNIAGAIVDSEGNKVKDFKTEVFGMGKFPVIPDPGKPLFAEVEYEGETFKFPLPAPLEKGYLLAVRNTGANLIVVAKHSDEARMADAFIVIHQRGEFLGVIKANGKAYIQSALKSANLRGGIITFTLFNGDGLPVRERIAFVENQVQSQKRFSINTNKETYRNREKVTMSLAELQADTALAGTASVSITNTALVPEDSRKSHLLSYLLLSSDIKGEIEDPAYYFNADNKKSISHLDLLMMIQGWRRFTWKDVLGDEGPSFEYPVEKGFWLEGKLSKFDSKNKAVRGEVKLSVMEDLLYGQTVLSDEEGYFYFRDVLVGDTVNMVIQAKKPGKKKSGNSEFAIEMLPKDELKESVPEFIQGSRTVVVNEAYQDAAAEIASIDSAFRLESGIVLLGEFEVRAQKDETKSPFYRAEVVYGKPSRRVIADSIAGVEATGRVFDLLRNTAGVQVRGAYPNIQIALRGNNSLSSGSEPLLLLDGVFTELDILSSLLAGDIFYIDILTGPDAAIFGANATNGAIAVYTKRGSGVRVNTGPRKGIINMEFAGFTVAREFFTPDYSIADDRHRKPDFRSTLYWNPNIDLSKGEPMEFFTSDEKGIYQVHVEGLTLDGKIINEDRLIEVK